MFITHEQKKIPPSLNSKLNKKKVLGTIKRLRFKILKERCVGTWVKVLGGCIICTFHALLITQSCLSVPRYYCVVDNNTKSIYINVKRRYSEKVI